MAVDTNNRHGPFITDHELASWTPKPELVKGLLASGEVNLLFAPKNRGKTFLGLDLAYSIATKQPTFLGRKILQHGSVVYLCPEGRNGLVLRREAWRVGRGYTEAVPGLAFVRDLIDLCDDKAVTVLITEIQKTYPDCALVVIDTLSQHMPGSDEGTAAMSTALHACQRIRDALNCTVLAIHHPTKRDEANERGGSGFRGGCADVLNVEQTDGVFYLTTQNTRDRAATTDAIPYVLKVVTLERFCDEEGRPLTSCVIRHLATAKEINAAKDEALALDSRILDALRAGPQSKKSLARKLRRRDTDVAVALNRLSRQRQVSRDRGGRWSATANQPIGFSEAPASTVIQ